MKKKIVIIVGIIIVVIIALVLLVRSLGTTTPLVAANEVPMYGFTTYEEYKAKRTPAIAKVDDDFITAIVAKKGSTKAALEDAIRLAWSYLIKGDSKTAMKRCNQAWLIDHANFNVDWCYGAVLGSVRDFEQSVSYFEKAISAYSASSEISPADYLPLYRDAAQAYTGLSDKYLSTDDASAKKYASKAIYLLSISLKDKNIPKEVVPMETFMLAFAYFNNGSYSEARKTYDEGMKKYPEYSSVAQLKEFGNELKKKGY